MKYRLSDEYFIRPIKAEDLEGKYFDWFNDPAVCKYNSHGVLPKTGADISNFLKSLETGRNFVWGIFNARDGHIGNVSLQQVSWINRTAELAILIGESAHWGKGVGRSACAALVSHAFQHMDLRRIFLSTARTNVGMVNLAESLGFVHEGTLREHLFLEGTCTDAEMYALLRSEQVD